MPTASTADSKLHLSPAERIQRRRLIVQDSLALLSLVAITICIAVVTYFFFHSFQQHRSVLEKRWFARGEIALASGHSADAVDDFRSALSFSSANTQYQMALAEALAASGRTDEAYAYFSTLHEAEPGDGYLNLQLARLAVRRSNPQQAIEYYQSALNGLWLSEGTERRRDIRLELARYLLSLHRFNDAQGQLLAAEGNALDSPSALFAIANLLRQAQDPSDASTAFQRVERSRNASPSDVLASLLAESQIAASVGQYKHAMRALNRYMAKARQYPAAVNPEQKRSAEHELDTYQRMSQLIPFDGLPPRQRADRVLLMANIAHRRYQSCLKHPQSASDANSTDADLLALGTQWTQWAQSKSLAPNRLSGDTSLQQYLMTWSGQAELLTAKLCGAPTGDDALLLQLTQTPDKTE